jgi:hypothetical protein
METIDIELASDQEIAWACKLWWNQMQEDARHITNMVYAMVAPKCE